MNLQEIRQSETLTISEKKMLMYDRMLTLTALYRHDHERYSDLLTKYHYWKLKVYGYAGEQVQLPYDTARYVLRKMSEYYMRLWRTDI